MNREKLRRGQCQSLQWTITLLNKVNDAIDKGEDVIKISEISDKQRDYKALQLGNTITECFLLPFSIELGLKAILEKEKGKGIMEHSLTKIFDNFSKETKDELNKIYKLQCGRKKNIREILEKHKNDFIGWRYLDNPENLQMNYKELQYVIYSILDYLYR